MPSTPLQKFRAETELWERFAEAVEASPDAEANRSSVLRQFLRWYCAEPGAQLPRRPSDPT